MIGSLEGKISIESDNKIIIEVGGVGYLVRVSPATAASLKKMPQAKVLTYLAVREDALNLYGFITQDELHLFELLLSVPGIGPKGALAVLSLADVVTLEKAIATGDGSYLTRVSGIGKKTAEKIVLELKDKIGGDQKGSGSSDESDIFEALRALGYQNAEIRSALKQLPDEGSVEEKIRLALKQLGR